MSKVTEETIQGVLMRWLMSAKNHIYVLPNSNTFFGNWEADVISVTRSLLSHEYEIKLNIADYKRDSKKWKHQLLGYSGYIGPSYFWYVTHNFEIEPPANAGWLNVYLDARKTWIVDKRKAAPRLSPRKISDNQQLDIGRLLSWRIANIYGMRDVPVPEVPIQADGGIDVSDNWPGRK